MRECWTFVFDANIFVIEQLAMCKADASAGDGGDSGLVRHRGINLKVVVVRSERVYII